MCHEVTYTCSAVDLASISLQWFFNDLQFAFYSIRLTDEYPVTVEPQGGNFIALASEVNITILVAKPNENNANMATFLSTMTVNISALREAGVSTVSCGDFVTSPNITLTNSRGKVVVLVC